MSDVTDTESPTTHDAGDSCPHCNADIGELLRRARDAAWAEARRHFEGRTPAKARRELHVELAERVEQLERGLITVLNRFSGTRGVPKSTPAAEKE